MKNTQKIKGKYNIEKLIPDTSVIIEGLVSKYISSGQIKTERVIIHEAVLGELENQANSGKITGDQGLEEISKLRKLARTKRFKLEFGGRRPTAEEIKQAKKGGEIDALIRGLASSENGTLFTADKVQAKVADAKGIKNIFVKIEQIRGNLSIEDFFYKDVESVHIRENDFVFCRKGFPGKRKLIKTNKKLGREDIDKIAKEVYEEAIAREDGFVETDRKNCTIASLGKYRIIITRPPFSDFVEITALKQLKKTSLKDYKLSKDVMALIEKRNVLVAGQPGAGKSCFASAVSDYLKERMDVKVIESPRDMKNRNGISKYSLNNSNPDDAIGVVLLSRPDYVIFDSMQNDDDFHIFSELCASGVNVLGVIDAGNIENAIKQSINKARTAPDVIIFIRDGKVANVVVTKEDEEGILMVDYYSGKTLYKVL